MPELADLVQPLLSSLITRMREAFAPPKPIASPVATSAYHLRRALNEAAAVVSDLSKRREDLSPSQITAHAAFCETRDGLQRLLAHAADRCAILTDMDGDMGPHFALYARGTLDALRQLLEHHTCIASNRSGAYDASAAS